MSFPTPKLRLGIIGGGPGSFIGPVHRIAARMSDQYELVAAVLSSKPEKSIQYSQELGIGRAYPSWENMIEAEAAREDGIEVLAIMTPNDTHYPISVMALEKGMHVICDKPLCNKVENARDLVQKVHASEQVYCVTYNYSAYPMVRQAMAMIKNGDLGEIKQVHVQYLMSYIADPRAPLGWRGNKEMAGPSPVIGDLATHAYHLGSYVTGLSVKELMADVGPSFEGRPVDDYISCMFHYENGARGSLWVTNAAAGGEHGLRFKIFGEKGGLEWQQEDPNVLMHRRIGDYEVRMTRRNDGKLYPEAEAATHLVLGHPEGFHDAFTNLYSEVAKAIHESQKPSDWPFPTVEDGTKGVEFIYAALESSASRAWVKLE